MKWRDALKAAIRARASATGCHSRCATLVATWNATVATGGSTGRQCRCVTFAEPKTDPTKSSIHAHTRRGEACGSSVLPTLRQARVRGKSLAYNIRPAKHLVPDLFGPVAPDTFRRWHDGGAPGLRDRPPVYLPLFALSRLANLTHAVAGRLSLSVPTWQHVYRRVLRELDIEFEPSRRWTRQFPVAACSSRGNLLRFAPASRPSEADTARERKLLQLRVIYLCDRFKISTGSHVEPGRDSCAHGSSRRAWVDQKSRASLRPRLTRLRHGHARCEHEGRHVDADRPVRGRATEHIFTGHTFPCQLVSHSPTHWVTQEALLRHDRRDRRGHARARW